MLINFMLCCTAQKVHLYAYIYMLAQLLTDYPLNSHHTFSQYIYVFNFFVGRWKVVSINYYFVLPLSDGWKSKFPFEHLVYSQYTH